MWTLLFGALAVAQTLSFDQALERAPDAPAVIGAQRAREVRRSEASGMHGLTDNPTIQLQPGWRDIDDGTNGPEVYVSVLQRFRLTGYGEKRKTAVQRELRVDGASYDLALLEARLSIAQAWLARWAAQEALDMADREVALARELLQRMQGLLAAGEATHVDVALIEVWEAEATLLRLSAEGRTFENGIDLARTVGVEAEVPLGTTPDLPALELPSEPALRASFARLNTAPRVAAARAMREADAARLAELRASRGTELGLGAMGWREGGGDLAAVATIEIVLPIFERGRRESSAAAASLAQSRELERKAQIDTRAERLRIIHEVVHTREVLKGTERALRIAENLAEAQRKRLEAREGTAQDWVLARRAVLRSRIDTVQARAAHVLARFRAAEALRPAAARRSQ